MKLLLHKELKLTTAPITWFFLLFAFMALIPGYPILVSCFFICMGMFYSYQFAREADDILYTALLPIRKKDVVTAKYLCTLFIETIAFLLLIVMTMLRMTVLKDAAPYVKNPLMAANITFLSLALVIFALFNFIFIKGFFKTAYNYGKPFILFCIAAFIVVGFGETLHYLPGMSGFNAISGEGMVTQWVLLAISSAAFLFLTYSSLKISQKRFEDLDL